MLRSSTTAGCASSAAAPTSWVGMPRGRSAESTATRSAPVAASTAMSLQATDRPVPRAAWVATISPTTQSISCAYVSNSAQDTAPGPLPFAPAVSGSTPPCTVRRCAEVRLATSRMFGAGATVLRQREPCGGSIVADGREVLREVLDVVDAGAAPAVDRLAGVADGHHRMPVAEDPLQQHALRDRGVLVLVEQHDAVARAKVGDDVGEALHDLAGQPDLVGEVEHVAGGLLRPPLHDEVGEQGALRGRAHVGADLLQGLEGARASRTMSSSNSRRSAGVDAELGQLVVEAQQVLGDQQR